MIKLFTNLVWWWMFLASSKMFLFGTVGLKPKETEGWVEWCSLLIQRLENTPMAGRKRDFCDLFICPMDVLLPQVCKWLWGSHGSESYEESHEEFHLVCACVYGTMFQLSSLASGKGKLPFCKGASCSEDLSEFCYLSFGKPCSLLGTAELGLLSSTGVLNTEEAAGMEERRGRWWESFSWMTANVGEMKTSHRCSWQRLEPDVSFSLL